MENLLIEMKSDLKLLTEDFNWLLQNKQHGNTLDSSVLDASVLLPTTVSLEESSGALEESIN